MENKCYKATIHESFFCSIDRNMLGSTIYYIFYLNDNFNIEIYKKAVTYVVKAVPILSCKFSEGYWRDKWQQIKEFNVSQIFKKIHIQSEVADKEAFNELAFSEFIKLKDKHIDIKNESPIKITVFYNSQSKNKMITIGMHHSVADVRGWLEIICLIGQCYNLILEKKLNNQPALVSKITKPIFHISIKDNINMLRGTIKNLFETNRISEMDPLIKKEKIKTVNVDCNTMSVEKINLGETEVKKLKAYYKGYGFTINDIVLHLLLKFNKKYNSALEKSNKYIETGMRIDIRKYIRTNKKFIGNYSFLQYVWIKDADVEDIEKVNEKLKRIKRYPMGLSAFYKFYLFLILPTEIMRKEVLKRKGEVVDELYLGMTSTNIGKMDKYLEPYKKFMEDAFVIPCGFAEGFPLMCITGYKNKITINFIRYNDKDGLTRRVKYDFKKILDEIIL
ncbi:NRPS condensation-like uncharacterized protein [Clostridium acetobutylicum]|uniref:Siderophore/Surfactin synthetase related protein n=1 Tax=Clostridium acetobutylicum (strain ATCC 824 / DSM 792 / JCM 1419 / IAM 19013 / LMG 5710 / NBRC 13948 / NRRL B-527 / VKM B-1787 / 2291 / W) TaxID=272562 RepID=Q97HK7_CLOAB|nr:MULTISPECIES: siderophore synthetase [Clostridium]AAK79963.1 Siderophore/Surfactin synthetase related protein [Clostridium acetobutylicum ATCC 824]AEI32123.1 siderophore/Surfactin synthetase related protein [Clostridium acetobutylicum DSM 1731]AWV79605.1 siderophore synthetase [Clostridium acetobutylicum]MBC2394421.1 siderophore synthetase [Clostridium acetobutylicum]MBC2583383.1 siderophore synthetase [Clostridium acetobutylicum]